MNSSQIIEKYIKFFEDRGHKRIPNSPLVPQNDPTTLFTSAGMQPLIPYLLGQEHPQGKKLVDVQSCFRAVDIDEVGDNRHTTFFRMLGNWSLGEYFKKEEIPWLWEFLTKELELPKKQLFITVFAGDKNVEFDSESEQIWKKIFSENGLEPKIFKDTTNWWSRSGPPNKMPSGEPGGPDTEVYYRFDDDQMEHKPECKDNPVECECGKFLEIANSVFIQYQKQEDGFIKELSQKNVDFGGGLERLLAAAEDKPDIFQTSIFAPVIAVIELETGKAYKDNEYSMRIIADHIRGGAMLISQSVTPSNKERGYILRRLLRKSFDMWYKLGGKDLYPIIESIIEEENRIDIDLKDKFEEIKNTILEEEQKYSNTIKEAKSLIAKKYKKVGDELMGEVEISAQDAFMLYTSHGLSPTQIKSLGYVFDDQKFAELMEKHQKLSRVGAKQKFAGGLADHSEKTVMGHTATHLLHQALRDVLGNQVHQTGSNITEERIRFDFNYDKALTEEELKKVEEIINEKIKDNLPVHFEMMPLTKAKEIGAIGLFDDKYQENVKVYFIGDYSKEFCGGPHVDFTGKLKQVKIIKQENIGKGRRRIYAKVGD